MRLAQQVFAARDWSRDLLLMLAIFQSKFFVKLVDAGYC